jgi:hypothetical protein
VIIIKVDSLLLIIYYNSNISKKYFSRRRIGMLVRILSLIEVVLVGILALIGSFKERMKNPKCPRCGSRESETLIGGRGGYGCLKCGTKFNEMGEEEWYQKVFR